MLSGFSGFDNEHTDPFAVDPDEICVSYLACADAAALPDVAQIHATYGPDSACWGSADAAEDCAAACTAALDLHELEDPTISECWGYVPPPAEALFAEIGVDWVLDEVGGCRALTDGRVLLSGDDGPTFQIEIEYRVYEPYRLVLPCTLAYDRTFECVSPEQGEAVGAGSFSPAFDQMDLVIFYDLGGYCEVEALPL